MMTAEQHSRALTRIDELLHLDPALNTPEGAELESLASQVEQYEREVYPLTAESFSAHRANERLLRLFEELAEFYELPAACAFVRAPQTLLGGKTALELMSTDAGAAEVFDLVARLRDGAYV